jgi:hypothetical protein
MVPVPSEHVLDIMRWVMFRAPEQGDGTGRDAARVLDVMAKADDVERALLLRVAEATVRREEVRLEDAAAELDLSAKDLGSLVSRLNHKALGGRRTLVRVRGETDVGIRGKRGRVSYLEMRPDMARIIRDTAKAPG